MKRMQADDWDGEKHFPRMTQMGADKGDNRSKVRPAWLVGACVLAAVIALAGMQRAENVSGAELAQPVGEEFVYYFPLLNKAPGPEPAPIVFINPSFESDTVVHWEWNWPRCRHVDPNRELTDAQGNQHPRGWTFYSPATNQVMPFPEKRQQGEMVPALSGGPGEYVHKCWVDAPDEEKLGAARAVYVEGYWVYKAFSDHIPHALVLTQELSAQPGFNLRVTGYILGESPSTACGSLLEDDHFIASVQLGDTADTRLYVDMKDNFQLPGNERPWNKFSVQAVVPPSSKVLLKVIVQANWGCQTDFFIDNFYAVQWHPSGQEPPQQTLYMRPRNRR